MSNISEWCQILKGNWKGLPIVHFADLLSTEIKQHSDEVLKDCLPYAQIEVMERIHRKHLVKIESKVRELL